MHDHCDDIIWTDAVYLSRDRIQRVRILAVAVRVDVQRRPVDLRPDPSAEVENVDEQPG